MKPTFRCFACAALLLAGLTTVHAETIVFQEDFESGAAPSQAIGGSVESTGAIHPSTGNYQWHYGAMVALTGLPVHSQIRISFTLLTWDSWDGLGSGNGPDYFNVKLDGTSLFAEAFAVTEGTTTFVTSGGAGYSGSILVAPSSSDYNYLGWPDAAYTVDIDFVNHTSSNATFQFFRSLASEAPNFAADESHGLDNITIAVSDTPEPASFALSALGISGLFVLRRRLAA
ncbi:MAG: PEP-CTERM sorting domain-containing protein [Acidobacteria bacterium]|nr:PEP-CTERM sorting domain-containing protein [Acidobacteriota bacterium]